MTLPEAGWGLWHGDDGAVRVFAPAKINLTLHVAAPDPGGLHPLDSLVMFATGCGDLLLLRPAGEWSLDVTGPHAGLARPDGDNLVARAARALAEAAGRPLDVAVTLDKQLPVASGMGGGSSDAAATLLGLNALWELDWPLSRLAALARPLGSDVPACLDRPAPLRMTGYGAGVAPAAGLPPLSALLANPGVACPTGPVYRRFDALGAFDDLARDPGWMEGEAGDAPGALAARRNSLEPAACMEVPEVGRLLSAMAALPGVRLARMSGSGATCFALFDTMEAAHEGEAVLRAGLEPALPGLWTCPTRLAGSP